MGAGKTTVAGLLAEAWGVAVRDTDADVEAAEGRSIADIFVDSGEDALPRARARRRSPRRSPPTTACSRSAGERCSTRPPATLLAGHRVVFLRVGLSDAVKRVGLGTARPLLLGNVRGRIKALLDERTPVYESVATLVVDTDGRTPDEVADEMSPRWRGRMTHERDTILAVAGAAPYDVVVGHGLADAAARRCSATASQRVALSVPTASPSGPSRCSTRWRRRTTCSTLRAARRRGRQDRRGRRRLLGGARRGRLHPLRRGGDRRRRRDHRPRRLRRRDLAARRPGRARADHAARHGRRGGRRQDRHQHRRRQEPGRLLPRARRRALRPRPRSRTLPRAELVAGLGEVVKCGFIADPEILDLVEADPAAALDPDSAVLRELVERAIRVKVDVVVGDLRRPAAPTATRAARCSTTATRWRTRSRGATDYRVRHGEAVAIGCVYVAELARLRRAARRRDVAARHHAVLAPVGLPTTWSGGALRRPARGDAGRQEGPRRRSCGSWCSTGWPSPRCSPARPRPTCARRTTC